MAKTTFDYGILDVTVALIRKKAGNGDVAPIYWRITHERNSKLLKAGLSFTEKEWDEFCSRDLQKHKDDKTILRKYFESVLRPAIDELVSTGNFSLEAFSARVKGGNRQSVNDAFTSKIKALNDSNKVGNAIVYQTAYTALVRYQFYRKLRDKGRKEMFIDECRENRYVTKGAKVISTTADILFSDVNIDWLNGCERFWGQIGVNDASIGMYMRTFRALINNKGGDPYLSGARYPFGVGKYEIPEGGRKEIALPIDDIRKIENFESENLAQEIARDVFMFLFYGNGMNFGDMCRLQYSNIDAATGEIVFQRAKTLKKGKKPTYIYVPVLPSMMEIINRLGNKDKSGYIFPFLGGIDPDDEKSIKETINIAIRPINTALKTIAAALELDPDLSTGYARNSYISYLTAELMVNPIVTKKMVGHTTTNDVTAGYVNLTAKKRREINIRLLDPEKKYHTVGMVAI